MIDAFGIVILGLAGCGVAGICMLLLQQDRAQHDLLVAEQVLRGAETFGRR